MKSIQRFKLRSFIICACLLAGLGIATQASAEVEASYFIDLNSKTASRIEGRVSAINDVGQVVGEFGGHAFITGPDGVGMTDLGTLGGDYSSALGINDAGQVVGYSYTAAGVQHAFITGPDGVGMTDLGTLGGAYSSASGINDAGQVVGNSLTAAGAQHAYITSPNGVGMTDLGTLGGDYSSASGINNAGQVVGNSLTAVAWSAQYAFITGPDGVGMTALKEHTYASAINEAGQVVGTYGASEHAFITGPDGEGMTDLGTLAGFERRFPSSALGINEAGQVVGTSQTVRGGAPHAFITGPNGVGMTDLNSLIESSPGGIVMEAVGINNVGQVIAIPEPESYALMLAGLILVGFMARQKGLFVKGN